MVDLPPTKRIPEQAKARHDSTIGGTDQTRGGHERTPHKIPFCRDGTSNGTLFCPEGTPLCPNGTQTGTQM